MLRVAVSLQLLLVVGAYIYYQKEIPNGDHVPHPCKPNHLWHGLGHKNSQGSGARNPFGLDFAASGHKFTRELCLKDSDGDGRTNGEELGDPHCVWTKGQIPERTDNLTHPGVCEPLDSPECMRLNNWGICNQTIEYQCNDTETEDVRNITLRFPLTTIPPTETNYFCMLFDLPSDRDYHIVGTKPSLDNLEVIHHMVVYGCNTEDPGNVIFTNYSSPAECGMMVQGVCGTGIAGWTVGSVGSCNDGVDAGIRFGKTIYSKVLVEFHWNNPRKIAGLKDSSGITLYYTPKLRTYDKGSLAIGQMGLFIPPNRERVEQTSQCKSECTLALTEPINIVSVNIHMHYLGIAGSVYQYRNNTLIRKIAADDIYHYDTPVGHVLTPPVVVMPGDELRTTCVYKSIYKSNIVYYGEGTAEEMCFAFLSYYPKTAFTDCVQFGNISTCGRIQGNQGVVDGCDLEDNAVIFGLVGKLMEVCDHTGETCLPECKKLLVDDVHPCLDGDVKMYLEFLILLFDKTATATVAASRSCDRERYLSPPVSDGERRVPGHLTLLLGTSVMISLAKDYL